MVLAEEGYGKNTGEQTPKAERLQKQRTPDGRKRKGDNEQARGIWT